MFVSTNIIQLLVSLIGNIIILVPFRLRFTKLKIKFGAQFTGLDIYTEKKNVQLTKHV